VLQPYIRLPQKVSLKCSVLGEWWEN